MEPRAVIPLAQTRPSETIVTQIEIMGVSTGERVPVRKREFQAICSVRHAPPSATRRNRTSRVPIRLDIGITARPENNQGFHLASLFSISVLPRVRSHS